jgi:hypothetical protein
MSEIIKRTYLNKHLILQINGLKLHVTTKFRAALGSEKSPEELYLVRFQVLTAASMKMAVFWIVAACSLVQVYRRFRGACCLRHQGLDARTSEM